MLGRFIAHSLLLLAVIPRLIIAEGKSSIRLALASPAYTNLVRPSRFRSTYQIYDDYFGHLDEGIVKDHADRWNYHDQQIKYAATQWRYEHLSIGSMDYYGHAPYEGNVREEFARQVLRRRIDGAIRKYFERPERAREIKRARQTLDKVANYRVPLPQPKKQNLSSSRPAEMRVGYDVFSDATKLEYFHGFLEIGFYFPEFISQLVGDGQGERLVFRMGTRFGGDSPNASLRYLLNSDRLETGLSKRLSPSVDAHLVSTQPVGKPDSQVSSYEARISIRF